ncbi:response regulator [Paenibacillus sp. HWE-109]|uniref:response regulator transcription factor n=1 Tax=Paenibacillus sp. HWE-109 TaxID=1306526 RepID=UPI001EDCCFD4|nr:response regulator [Paenibacillus sp. HWE-109]UKS27949.1 response regulator [Paenibacillus sp. HWE-109]
MRIMPTLMIVDDEETIRQGLGLIIERLSPNWKVISSVEDSEQAVQMLNNLQPDLIIIDISMPGMSGLDLAKYVFECYPHIYKMILTGHDKFAYAQSALRYEVVDYLLKPLDRDELVAALRQIDSRLAQRVQDEGGGRLLKEAEWDNSPISDAESQLIIAIETNDTGLAQLLFRQWASDLRNPSHARATALAMQLHYFFSLVFSRVLNHVDTKLSLRMRRDAGWLASAFTPQQSVSFEPFAVMLEQFADKLETDPTEQRTETRRVIETVKAYINEHYHDSELKLEALAQLVYMNTNYISELFKQVTGDNFIDYLTMTRMKAAKQMLRETNLKTYEIAERVGYTSAKYFSTLFRRIYGMTPTEYRDRSV